MLPWKLGAMLRNNQGLHKRGIKLERYCRTDLVNMQ